MRIIVQDDAGADLFIIGIDVAAHCLFPGPDDRRRVIGALAQAIAFLSDSAAPIESHDVVPGLRVVPKA